MKNIPEHIAIIMDGNGRWAETRRLPKIEGHRMGVGVVEEVLKGCLEKGVKVLSLYTFSTENWKRPRREVRALMVLLEQYLKKYTDKLKKNGIRLVVSGDIAELPVSAQRQVQKVMQATKQNRKLVLNLALNYGSREEIIKATQAIARQVAEAAIAIDDIDQELFADHLYTKGLPEPDLLIRTSGELRLSNFFLWQLSYTELYFTPKLWPDFKKEDLFAAIDDFRQRERRFGS